MPEKSDRRYDTAVGQRIQSIRRQRGLTQHGLAQRAGISYGHLTKVESGHRAASPTVTAACARALRVPVTDLTGQPYFDALRQDELDELVQPLRQAVANPMLPLGQDLARPVRGLAALRREIAGLEESRLRGEYMPIGVQAPALIDELLLYAADAVGERREQAFGALAGLYRLAHSFTHKLGFLDLGMLALDRMDQAVAQGPDPLMAAVVCHYRSNYFLYSGAGQVALREVEMKERMLSEHVRRGDPRALSLQGSMHLKAAVLHARSRTPTAAAATSDRIAAARETAARLAAEAGHRDPYGLTFDQHNVEVHAVSSRLDLGDAGVAVEQGESVRFPERWALNRSGHHHMDMARGYERLGRREEALAALAAARSAAPVQTRYHPTTRETTLALLRGRGTPSRQLTAFARWVGV